MSDNTDELLESHKFSPDGSLFSPVTLQEVRDRLEYIDAHECNCCDSPHEDALHDLAHDDVPVLLKVIEQQATEVERLRHELTERYDPDVWANQSGGVTLRHHIDQVSNFTAKRAREIAAGLLAAADDAEATR